MLPNDMHSLGKALVKGTSKTVAHATFECPSLRPHIEELVTKEISNECKSLCSFRQPSILRSISKTAVADFSWSAVSNEFKNRAPLFYKVLLAGAGNDKDSLAVTNAAEIVLKQHKAMSFTLLV